MSQQFAFHLLMITAGVGFTHGLVAETSDPPEPAKNQKNNYQVNSEGELLRRLS